jgi:hypothetical protein
MRPERNDAGGDGIATSSDFDHARSRRGARTSRRDVEVDRERAAGREVRAHDDAARDHRVARQRAERREIVGRRDDVESGRSARVDRELLQRADVAVPPVLADDDGAPRRPARAVRGAGRVLEERLDEDARRDGALVGADRLG